MEAAVAEIEVVAFQTVDASSDDEAIACITAIPASN